MTISGISMVVVITTAILIGIVIALIVTYSVAVLARAIPSVLCLADTCPWNLSLAVSAH